MPNLPPSRAKNAGICLYDGDALVAEIDLWGNGLAEYVWGQLGPVAQMERSGLYGYRVLLYVCDALGHVRMLIDASTGQVVDRYAYDAWGNLIAREGNTRQPFTWNGAYGYEWIPEVGLYHVGARAYDPRTARWLQRDPIGIWGGRPNLYLYLDGDPINWADPEGAQPRRKKPATEEECNQILDEIEKLLNSIDTEMDKNEKFHPVQDVVGCQGKWTPAGHSRELNQWLEALDKLWAKYSNLGCHSYARIRVRAGQMAKRQSLLEKRIANWLAKLQQLPDNLLRQIIDKFVKDPDNLKHLIRILRRAAKFVPYLGQILTIILFIYDWYQGGFWHAVKGLVVQNTPLQSNPQKGTIVATGGTWRYVSSLLYA